MKKISNNSIKVAKKAIYYGFIPLVIILGVRTIKFDALMSQQPMWYMIYNIMIKYIWSIF